MPRRDGEAGLERLDRVVERLLGLLQILVVGQRQALHDRQQRDQVADRRGPTCRATARRCRGSSSAASGRAAEQYASPIRTKPNSAVDHSTSSSPRRDRWTWASAQRGDQLDREVAVADGVERVVRDAGEARARRRRARDRSAASCRPARRSRAADSSARRAASTIRPRSRSSISS